MLMQWFLVKLVYRIVCGDGRHMPQFDEQLRIIHAADPGEALQKAEAIGLREEDCFVNQQQHPVRWQFINVAELYPVQGWIDGAELYSRVQEMELAEPYIAFVQSKALGLRQQFLQPESQPV